MVKLRAHKVIVLRDETTRIPKKVAEWELPILEARHPEGYVIRSDDGEIEFEREELPNAGEEFDRLTRVYGADDGGRDLTELVFGYRQKGVAELDKLIKGSVVGAKQVKASKKKVTSKKESAAPPVDPLGDD